MKLKYEFITTELGNQFVAVPVGDNARDFGGVINLNASAAFILKQMQKDTTVEQIVSALMEEYEGTQEEATAYVEGFIGKLREEDLLSE